MKSIEAYKTADGKLFEDYDKANDHIRDECSELLDEKLKKLMTDNATGLTRSQVVKIISALTNDLSELRKLVVNLRYWLDN